MPSSVGELESRVTTPCIKCHLGISDLMVAAPPSGEQRRHRRHYRVRDIWQPRAAFSGTPIGQLRHRVSVCGRSVASDDRVALPSPHCRRDRPDTVTNWL